MTLQVNVSMVGLGAVLIHKDSKVDKPVAFLSKSLTSSEIRYANVFGCMKFHTIFMVGHSYVKVTLASGGYTPEASQ